MDYNTQSVTFLTGLLYISDDGFQIKLLTEAELESFKCSNALNLVHPENPPKRPDIQRRHERACAGPLVEKEFELF